MTEPGAATFKDQLRSWTEDNPLRAWRKRNRLSMMDASVALDASLSSVQQWEQGGYEPNDESMAKIASALDVKLPTLQRKWRAWWNARPTR